jgi:hypothetical protein
MLQGFMRGAAGGEGAEGFQIFGGEWIVAVGEEPCAVASEDVREQGFGITASVIAGELGGGFEKSGLKGHRSRQ